MGRAGAAAGPRVDIRRVSSRAPRRTRSHSTFTTLLAIVAVPGPHRVRADVRVAAPGPVPAWLSHRGISERLRCPCPGARSGRPPGAWIDLAQALASPRGKQQSPGLLHGRAKVVPSGRLRRSGRDARYARNAAARPRYSRCRRRRRCGARRRTQRPRGVGAAVPVPIPTAATDSTSPRGCSMIPALR
jgi:hypothetical protein